VHRLRGDRNDPLEVLRFEVSVEQQLVAETLEEAEQQQPSPPESLEQADEARAIGWIAKSTTKRQARICRANPGRVLLLRCLVLVFMGLAGHCYPPGTSVQLRLPGGGHLELVRREVERTAGEGLGTDTTRPSGPRSDGCMLVKLRSHS
jgi:hypothetical protein